MLFAVAELLVYFKYFATEATTAQTNETCMTCFQRVREDASGDREGGERPASVIDERNLVEKVTMCNTVLSMAQRGGADVDRIDVLFNTCSGLRTLSRTQRYHYEMEMLAIICNTSQ